ncbi:hypothetical protein Leryth_011189 [Lithospermum erythrorhizon]|nr:hypothetical protein Leryth_011189 [Lithospermum erythrorhizon]
MSIFGMQSLMFSKAKKCVVDGVNFLNAKGVHLKVTGSEEVSISNVKVTAPDESPNTDGIVISNSNRITVTNCNIGTGDDCVAIGDTNVGVNVSQVTCGPGHGLSVGSLGKRTNEGDVKDIRVWNCTCTGTTNGVRIKTYRASPILKATNIVFDDIIMNAVKNPVLIDQHYDSKNKKEPSNVHISDVHFTNIRGTTISQAPVALNCSDAFPCDAVELNNIDLVPAPESKFKTVTSVCANTKFALLGKSVNPAGCEAVDAAAATVGHAVNTVADSVSAAAFATSDAAGAAAEIAAQADQEVAHELADIDHF